MATIHTADPKTREAAAAHFDALLAQSPQPDAQTLRQALDLELQELWRKYSADMRVADVSRLLLLAGATRDYELWKQVVRYFTAVDAAHRELQQLSGVPKEDLGPYASEERTAVRIRRQVRRSEVPETVWPGIEAVLAEYEATFLESRRKADE